MSGEGSPVGWRAAATDGARRVVPILLLVALGLLAFRELIGLRAAPAGRGAADSIDTFFFHPNQKSALMIFGIAAWILATRAPLLRACVGRPPHWLGVALTLAPGAALCVWAHYTASPTLLVLSLSLTLLGSAALLGGRNAMRTMRLPALFLLLAIPIPPVLLNQLIFPMQLLTAHLTGVVLGALGIPVVVSGDIVFTRIGVFQVIESCSGLRSIETLIMAAILYQEIFQRDRLRSWILLLSSPFIGLLVNQIRVLTIVFNPYGASEIVHAVQGLVMIVAGVLLIAALDRLLDRLASRSGSVRLPLLSGPASDLAWPATRGAILGGVLLSISAATAAAPAWQIERPERVSPYSLPGTLDGWQAEVLRIDGEYLGSTRFTQAVSRRYRRDGQIVDVFVGVDDRKNPFESGLSPKNGIPGSSWRIEENVSVSLPAAAGHIEARIVASPRGRALLYYWHDGWGSVWWETFREIIGLDRSPLQRPYTGVAVRVSTPLPKGTASRTEAERRLLEWTIRLREAFPTPSRKGP